MVLLARVAPPARGFRLPGSSYVRGLAFTRVMSSRFAARAAASSSVSSSSRSRRSMACCSRVVMRALGCSMSSGAPSPDWRQACSPRISDSRFSSCWVRAAIRARRAGALAGPAWSACRVQGGGTVLGWEVGEEGGDAGEERPDAGDLLLGWHRLGAGPLLDVGGGEEPLAVAQQVVQVGLQVGEVGHVGAEVVAARAAEPERAGMAAGLDVGRLAAAAEGDHDLADGAAGVLGVQQRLGRAPDTIAVPVELQGGDPVDRLAAALLADAIVPFCGI